MTPRDAIETIRAAHPGRKLSHYWDPTTRTHCWVLRNATPVEIDRLAERWDGITDEEFTDG